MIYNYLTCVFEIYFTDYSATVLLYFRLEMKLSLGSYAVKFTYIGIKRYKNICKTAYSVNDTMFVQSMDSVVNDRVHTITRYLEQGS